MILVTGAAGHVGNVLVRELLQRGKSVRALVLPDEDRSALDGLAVEIAEGDVLEPDSLLPAFAGVEIVYHLAGIISILPGKEALMRRVNIEGTRHVLAAALQAGVRRMVYTSSIHALQRPPRGMVIDESLHFDVSNPAGEYDRSKAAASLEVTKAVAEYGLDAVIVCPTGVVGPFDFRRSEMGELIRGWMANKVSLTVDGFFDFVDVRDVARGHILACENGRRGATYILGGERVSLEWMWRIVRQVTGLRASSIKIPMPLAMIGAWFTPLYYRLARTTPRFTRYALETVQSNSNISIARARHELGYQPRSLATTLSDTVNWWLDRSRTLVPVPVRSVSGRR
jgi:dihydroflavonol-4-reductase